MRTSILAAPGVGRVLGSERVAGTTSAAMLLSDRVANGDAFDGEMLVRLPRRFWIDRLGRLVEHDRPIRPIAFRLIAAAKDA